MAHVNSPSAVKYRSERSVCGPDRAEVVEVL
jgi:hypothetical protein